MLDFLRKRISLPVAGSITVGAALIVTAATYLAIRHVRNRDTEKTEVYSKGPSHPWSRMQGIGMQLGMGFGPHINHDLMRRDRSKPKIIDNDKTKELTRILNDINKTLEKSFEYYEYDDKADFVTALDNDMYISMNKNQIMGDQAGYIIDMEKLAHHQAGLSSAESNTFRRDHNIVHYLDVVSSYKIDNLINYWLDVRDRIMPRPESRPDSEYIIAKTVVQFNKDESYGDIIAKNVKFWFDGYARIKPFDYVVQSHIYKFTNFRMNFDIKYPTGQRDLLREQFGPTMRYKPKVMEKVDESEYTRKNGDYIVLYRKGMLTYNLTDIHRVLGKKYNKKKLIKRIRSALKGPNNNTWIYISQPSNILFIILGPANNRDLIFALPNIDKKHKETGQKSATAYKSDILDYVKTVEKYMGKHVKSSFLKLLKTRAKPKFSVGTQGRGVVVHCNNYDKTSLGGNVYVSWLETFTFAKDRDVEDKYRKEFDISGKSPVAYTIHELWAYWKFLAENATDYRYVKEHIENRVRAIADKLDIKVSKTSVKQTPAGTWLVYNGGVIDGPLLKKHGLTRIDFQEETGMYAISKNIFDILSYWDAMYNITFKNNEHRWDIIRPIAPIEGAKFGDNERIMVKKSPGKENQKRFRRVDSYNWKNYKKYAGKKGWIRGVNFDGRRPHYKIRIHGDYVNLQWPEAWLESIDKRPKPEKLTEGRITIYNDEKPYINQLSDLSGMTTSHGNISTRKKKSFTPPFIKWLSKIGPAKIDVDMTWNDDIGKYEIGEMTIFDISWKTDIVQTVSKWSDSFEKRGLPFVGEVYGTKDRNINFISRELDIEPIESSNPKFGVGYTVKIVGPSSTKDESIVIDEKGYQHHWSSVRRQRVGDELEVKGAEQTSRTFLYTLKDSLLLWPEEWLQFEAFHPR